MELFTYYGYERLPFPNDYPWYWEALLALEQEEQKENFKNSDHNQNNKKNFKKEEKINVQSILFDHHHVWRSHDPMLSDF